MTQSPQTFVLVHGAWHGAWNWRHVLPGLRRLGHLATAPTLSGLGERRHVDGKSIDLDTHVTDIVAHIETEDLNDITLVGASYGGMVVTGVYARIPERIARLVYLDGMVPEDGKAMVDYLPAEHRAFMDEAKANNTLVPPIPAQALGVTDPALLAFIEARVGPQSWRTLYQPVRAIKVRPGVAVTYVHCNGYGDVPSPFALRYAAIKKADPAARLIGIPTAHLCMMTAPAETIAVLTA
jgi:pimeloyl-ACP methyl ester carboxylesterase